MNKGIWCAVGAYAAWGLLPAYWKLLQQVAAIQIVGHRILWSFILLMAIILLTCQWRAFRTAALTWRVVGIYFVAAVLLSLNWLMYIWGVNAGFIVETSLGYFINPLLNVLLGVVFLRERLRPLQWLPIGMAATGVIYLTIAYGSLPWIALTLAFTFALYGLVKKTAPLGSLYGLTLETGILLLPASIYLLLSEATGQGRFLHGDIVSNLLLIGTGVVTSLPLLLFAAAAQRIPLTMMGIFQYISPTLQCLLGVLVYHETFTQTKFIGFGIIWVALLVFWLEGVLARKALLAASPEVE